jgi:hypothetical protein
MNTAPYFEAGRWYIDRDPDDEEFITADVSARLTDIGSTAVGVETVVSSGITVLVPAVVQGTNMVVKLTGFDDANNADNFCTFRVTCANTVRFDKTIWFRRQDN